MFVSFFFRTKNCGDLGFLLQVFKCNGGTMVVEETDVKGGYWWCEGEAWGDEACNIDPKTGRTWEGEADRKQQREVAMAALPIPSSSSVCEQPLERVRGDTGDVGVMGIRRIGNDADYYEFIETGYSDEVGLTMNVYIDHENEPVLDWTDMEVVEDDEGHYSEPDVDDDKESQLSDDIPYEHEADGYIPSLDKTVGDEFLHRVSGTSKDKNDELETDEVKTNNGDDKPVYPVHNENQKWDKMVPILGMRFSNPMELKICLTNYAVKNGYNLYYEKNDSQRGQLLAAMGRDANNHIFPIAWVVVAVENKETWKWFLDLLLYDIEMGIGHGFDGFLGLVKAVKERVPAAEHRQCARHIYANFKKRFKGEQYRKLFWAAAASTNQPKFEAEMNSIKTIDPFAYEHLMERDPKSWCRAFFKVDRACDAYENGILESFNSVIDLARKRPLLTMLEEIQIYAMERMYRMLLEGQSWCNLKIFPSIRLKISKLKKQQRFWELYLLGYKKMRLGLEMRDMLWTLTTTHVDVDLGKYQVSHVCMQWQPFNTLTGMQRIMLHHGSIQPCS
ncbi:unnamed protein product [Lactuca saligna]|uniref:MULE transposase domain-containing protein n=1 Tax=Lactuca saligna TaxID=75948 RepID=A0AA36ELL2_LACSI|nr:unnamed protein product [Lactuca saligna]